MTHPSSTFRLNYSASNPIRKIIPLIFSMLTPMLMQAQGWTIQSVGTTVDLNAFYPGYYPTPLIIFCNEGLILRSSDNGGTWSQIYGIAPPAVGVIALRGPLVFTGNTSDTAVYCNYRERVRLPRYREIKFNVMRWLAKNTPLEWREPSGYSQTYLALKGLLNNAQPIVHPSGYVTTFSHTGDPVAGTGWLLTSPADHRLMISVGPVTMNPGDTQVVVIAQVIARGTSNLNSITVLRQTAGEAINYYNSCYDPFPIGIETGSSQIPERYSLHQNYPNPFNASTKIKFDLPLVSKTILRIYDILGREAATLVNERLSPGRYELEWDGSAFASGIYFYELRAGDFVDSKKMVLIK